MGFIGPNHIGYKGSDSRQPSLLLGLGKVIPQYFECCESIMRDKRRYAEGAFIGKGFLKRAIRTRNPAKRVDHLRAPTNYRTALDSIGEHVFLDQNRQSVDGTLKGSVRKIDEFPAPVKTITIPVTRTGRIGVKGSKQARKSCLNLAEEDCTRVQDDPSVIASDSTCAELTPDMFSLSLIGKGGKVVPR